MPEAVRAVERETDVVDGAPLFVEREATRRVVEALERRAANPDEGDGLDADADFTCPNCGFTTFASRSFRLTCAKCGRCRDELPPRDAYLPARARARQPHQRYPGHEKVRLARRTTRQSPEVQTSLRPNYGDQFAHN